MCILFTHVNPNPSRGNYRMIVATNRDEQYKRPALPAHIDKNGIVGGRDMEPGREGGTWLCFRSKVQDGNNKRHCLGVLLNINGSKIENPKGRGFIVIDYLMSSDNFLQYAKHLNELKYSGYNFVSVELDKEEVVINHHSNFPNVTSSYSGEHTLAFGNSCIYSPLTKVKKGCKIFQEILAKNLHDEELIQELLKLLKNETKFLPDDELKKRVNVDYENFSSICIRGHNYGTRTHTIILVDYDWNMTFLEQTMEEPSNPNWKETMLNIKL